MSKVKTPKEKKRLSYEHDRRNTYGENQKSSRKNIPRSKQRSQQDERRSVRQTLVVAQGDVVDEAIDEAQSQVLRRARIKRLKAFRGNRLIARWAKSLNAGCAGALGRMTNNCARLLGGSRSASVNWCRCCLRKQRGGEQIAEGQRPAVCR